RRISSGRASKREEADRDGPAVTDRTISEKGASPASRSSGFLRTRYPGRTRTRMKRRTGSLARRPHLAGLSRPITHHAQWFKLMTPAHGEPRLPYFTERVRER